MLLIVQVSHIRVEAGFVFVSSLLWTVSGFIGILTLSRP